MFPFSGFGNNGSNSSGTNSFAGSQSPNHSDGRDTISNGEYAKKCRALMKLLRDLQDLRADTVFDLPRIVVIGSQSAGKSSLIEAVTGINVPRDSGTCTRCPMECTMSSAATSWSCIISLRHGEEEARRFGPVITNKSEVELWLRRAQGAILSTDANKAPWETKSADDIKQAIQAETGMRMFTEDTIVVSIQDQSVTDLSFVDLPGLIQNSDQNSINLIKNLVRKHIAGENTLILVTIPVSDDIQNQGAVILAQEADSPGSRTIGVLTKPDVLGPGAIGAHQIWKQILENQHVDSNKNYLQHGYYCVRLPDDEKRQQGYTAHNLPGANYFDITKPWSEVANRRRFGVTNLVQDVSALLVQLIEANLPKLRAAVEAALRACNDRLAQLPPPPQGDPWVNITLMINAFLRDLEAASIGDSHKTLAQECRKRYGSLREDILQTCPRFQPDYFEVANADEVTDEDDSDVYNISDVQQLIRDCTAWELPGFIPYDVYKTLIERFVRRWNEPVRECFEDVFGTFSSFLDQLSDVHFANYRNLKLFVLSHVRAELGKAKSETEASVRKLLTIEGRPFFTQRSDFALKMEGWTRHYRKAFFHREDVNQNRDEIHVMATVRTYFQFAYERFADTMLLMQEHELVQSLRPKLEETLFGKLVDVRSRVGGLENLLSEDQNIEEERRDLTSRRQKLMEIRKKLDDFSMT